MTYEELFYIVSRENRDWKYEEIASFIEDELFTEEEVMKVLTTVEPNQHASLT